MTSIKLLRIPRMPCSGRIKSLLFLLCVMSSLAGLSPDSLAAKRETHLQQISATQEPKYFSELAKKISLMLPKTGQLPGQSFPSAVRITRSGKNIRIELGRSFIPANITSFDSDLQPQLQHIQSFIVGELVRTNIDFLGIDFTFDGKPLEHYFPDELSQQPTDASGLQASSSAPLPTTVVVSGGHGLTHYLERTYNGSPVPAGWEYQRPSSGTNGIQEDLLTTEFAGVLATLLESRGENIESKRARSTSADVHAASTADGAYHWWQVSARYNFENLYPNNTFWKKTSNKTYRKEEFQDINSRPGFANFLKADALINIHINAQDGGTTTRGTQIYYNPKLAENKSFADNVSCYMKEIIQADDDYADWSVRAIPSTGYGENNLANMKTVLVEVGFDTNADDATAMKDPDFQQLAMKGVEKGYRLTKRSLGCVPLTINSVPDVSGPRGGPKIPVDVNYAGFPQFPLTLSIENISCSSGYCTGGAVTYPEEIPSPLQFTFSCNGSSSNASTSTWSSTLTDADGVKTEPVEHQLTCTPSSSTVAKRGTFSESVTVGSVK